MTVKSPQERLIFRRLRARRNVFGTAERPRLSVFRSSKNIYVQLVDDAKGRTLAAASTMEDGVKPSAKKGISVAIAKKVGLRIGEKAKSLKIDKAVFDRGGHPYHGRIKALAEGAREAGLQF